MSSNSEEAKTPFLALIEQARDGDPEALADLYDRYARHVRIWVRVYVRQMKHLQGAYDEQDLEQSVWRSFLTHDTLEQHFAGPEQFLAFLHEMIKRKALKAQRRLECQKRDARRVVSFATLGEAVRELIDPKEPDPADVLIAEDEWQQFLDAQIHPAMPKVLRLFRDGYIQQEVANILRCSVRTIRRLLSRVRLPDGSRPLSYMRSSPSPAATDRDMDEP